MTAPIELRDDVLDADRIGMHRLTAPPARLVYAAAHVILHDGRDPHASGDLDDAIDWDATMATRQFLSSNGFGIAEAMDTAQRYEIGWPMARKLIEQCAALDLPSGFVAGAAADHLDSIASIDDLVTGIAEQCSLISGLGGIPVVLSQPWLTRRKYDEDAFVDAYARLLDRIDCPVILHWLGPMFLASLEGNFPGSSFERIMQLDPTKIRGAKLSMLDDELELRLRRSMTEHDQFMLTGDDFHFTHLIEGEGPPTGSTHLGDIEVPTGAFSHALLGIFDGIAEPAGIALKYLAAGDLAAWRRIMQPCEELSRIIFEPPTELYKCGLAFLSWLNGRQSTPGLVNRLEDERDTDHYLRVAAAASDAGVIHDASLAMERLEGWCADRR